MAILDLRSYMNPLLEGLADEHLDGPEFALLMIELRVRVRNDPTLIVSAIDNRYFEGV